MTYPTGSHVRQPVQRLQPWESANLSFREDGQEDIRRAFSRKVSPDNQQRADSVKCGRLDEHGDDCPVQPANSS